MGFMQTAAAVRAQILPIIARLNTMGNIFFVGSTVTGASDSGDGTTPSKPFATLDYAIGKCTANQGDVIFLLPGHAETTTAIAADVAGIFVVGLGVGRNRPTLTATTAVTDLINVSASNVSFENFRLVGAASGNTALLDVAAADFSMRRMSLEPGATPLMSMTIASGNRGLIEDCQWLTSANGPDCAIDIESSASDHWIVRNCVFNATAGWDLGVIRANADTCLGWVIENCTFIKCDTVAIDFNSSASVSDGVVRNCTVLATAALTSIEDVFDVGGYKFAECYAHDGTNATTAMARVPIGTVS